MPSEARSLLGCLGFSCQSMTLPSSSRARMPKRCASPSGHALDGDGHVGTIAAVELDERLVVHLVDVVAGQDRGRCRRADWRIISMLTSTASAVPRYHSDGRPRAMYGCSRRMPRSLRSRSHGRPAPMWSFSERGLYCVRTRTSSISELTQLRQREVDDPVLARERHGRLGAHSGQDRQPLPFPTGEDDGDDPLHAAMLHRRIWRIRQSRRCVAHRWGPSRYGRRARHPRRWRALWASSRTDLRYRPLRGSVRSGSCAD